MKLRSKKAMEVWTLVEIIFFAILSITVGLFFVTKGLDWLRGQPATGTTKSLDSLKIEINLLEENENRTVPIYIDEYHIIKGFKIDSKPRPIDCEPTLKGEARKACLCVCKKETCDFAKGEVNKCQTIDFNLEEEFIIYPKIDKETEEPIPQNCKITKLEQQITISCG